jgi:uncharacterized protein (TIRG00374 family)
VLQRPINVGPLVLAACICTAALFITFFRWYVLVRAQDLPFTFRNALRLGLVGYFYNTFLPGSVGGDLFKAVGIAKEQKRRTVAVATVLIDRAIGLWALFWLVALFGGAFWLLGDPILVGNKGLMVLFRTSVIVVAATVAVWVALIFLPDRRAERFSRRLLWFPRVGKALSEFWLAVWLYHKRSGAIAAALALSLVGHFGFVLTYHFAAQAFQNGAGSDGVASFGQHLLIVPAGVTFQAFFPTPGGVGGGEAAFGWLYTLVDKPLANGILMSLTYRMIAWGLGFVGYLVYLRMRAPRPAAAPPEAPAENDEDDGQRRKPFAIPIGKS